MTDRSLPHRLVARVGPIQGESLLSLVSRACRANAFTHLDGLFQIAGVQGKAAFAPFTAFDHSEALASLLSVSTSEIESRLHPAVLRDPDPTVVWWGGIKMERRFIEARRRRVAPAALETSPHHRLSWTHRGLAFCPETFQTLISACHRCGQPLGWNRTCGPDVCEHCRARLIEARPPFAEVDLRPHLDAAVQLIATDGAVRARALQRLPSVFHDWDPGEAFSAICELGAAWEHPGEGSASAARSAAAEGSFERLSPQVVASGYEVLAGWPDSLDALVLRDWSATCTADPQSSASLRHLGLLGRHIDARLPSTRFRALIRERLPMAAKAAGVPQKTSLGFEGVRPTLTLTEAQRRFGVTKRVLSRLVPIGESCVSGRLGRGGVAALNPARLARAVEALRSGLEPPAAAAELGIPKYCLDAFIKRRLLRQVGDPDAALMADGDGLILRPSVEALSRALARIEPRTRWADAQPLQRCLAHKFSPVSWSRAFEAILTGQLPVATFDSDRPGGLSDRVHTDPEDVDAFLAHIRLQTVPRAAIHVTADEAGLLLGISGIYVPELIEARVLPAARRGRSWAIPLSNVVYFDRSFVHSASSTWKACLQRGGRLSSIYDSAMGIMATRHLRFCSRAVFNELSGMDV